MIIQLFCPGAFSSEPSARWRRAGLAFVVLSASLTQGACKKEDPPSYFGQEDRDEDGWPSELDCDDRDPAVFPGADEIWGDGIDQDCSGSDAEGGAGGFGGAVPDECEGLGCGSGGVVAEGGSPGTFDGSGGGDTRTDGSGGASTRGRDADGDGYDAAPDGDDCDDDRLEIHPGAVEIPLNGVDENCDGSDLVGAPELVDLGGDAAVPLEPPVIARIVVDGDERFLVAWSDSRKAPGQDIYGQIVDGDGTPVGDELEIEVFDNHKKTDLCLATSGSEFLVAWVDAEGLWTRQLDEEGSQVIDMPVGFGPPGSVEPRVAHSGDHWGVAWKDGVELTGFFRTMRETDRARWDVWSIGTDTVGQLRVASAGKGSFTLGWTDTIDESKNGIWAQTRGSKGAPDGDQVVAQEGNFKDLELAFDGKRTWMAFGVASQLSYAAITALDAATLEPLSQHVTQLSTEVVSLGGFQLDAFSGHAPFVVWNDRRHATGAPSATAIYGNGVDIDAGGEPQIDSIWSTARPILVDSAVELGGVSRSNDGALVTGVFNGRPFVLPVKF